MINVTLNLDTGEAVLDRDNTTIKSSASVSVKITCTRSGAVIDPDGINFYAALGDQGDTAGTLAYVESFDIEDSYALGVMDCSDTRLVEFMASRDTATLALEIGWTEDSVSQIAPDVSITCQHPVVDGDPSGEGGPVYLTLTNGALIPDTDPGVVGAIYRSGDFIAISNG